jgi:hypothetical protein
VVACQRAVGRAIFRVQHSEPADHPIAEIVITGLLAIKSLHQQHASIAPAIAALGKLCDPKSLFILDDVLGRAPPSEVPG